ncbi:hypothetical protein OsI_20113 [Oryza sativa Indica Group]|uniref:Uncharacterized protein n=1 Tax=Oryza sativa subsp. indica TaxID=39946 RepID=B8AYU3_ORYSI|nr:hypothetical protein OsI_20113 [Oryza sativa Indica Group]
MAETKNQVTYEAICTVGNQILGTAGQSQRDPEEAKIGMGEIEAVDDLPVTRFEAADELQRHGLRRDLADKLQKGVQIWIGEVGIVVTVVRQSSWYACRLLLTSMAPPPLLDSCSSSLQRGSWWEGRGHDLHNTAASFSHTPLVLKLLESCRRTCRRTCVQSRLHGFRLVTRDA